MVRLAANFGINFSAVSLKHGDRSGRGISPGHCQLLKLNDIVDFSTHGDIGDALQNDLDHDGNLELGHPGLGLLDGGC